MSGMNINEVLASGNQTAALQDFMQARLEAVAQPIAVSEEQMPDNVLRTEADNLLSRRSLLGLRTLSNPTITERPLLSQNIVRAHRQRRPRRAWQVAAAISVLGGTGAMFASAFSNNSETSQETAPATTQASVATAPATTIHVETTPVTTIDMSGQIFTPVPESSEVPVVETTLPVETVVETTVVPVETAPLQNPYEGVDCSESKTPLLEAAPVEQLALHCDISIEQLASFNEGVDMAQPGVLVNLWPDVDGSVVDVSDEAPEVTSPPPNTAEQKPATQSSSFSPDNCPSPNQVVTLGSGTPYFAVLGSLGLTSNQSNKLLFGTNFPKKYGWNLTKVLPGQEVCAPSTKEAITSVYTSVAAIQD